MKSSDFIVSPHSGSLVKLMVDDPEEKQSYEYKKVVSTPDHLSTLELSDLIMLGTGALSPLEGFMVGPDYRSVLENMRLSDGTLWPLPITLTIDMLVNIEQEIPQH